MSITGIGGRSGLQIQSLVEMRRQLDDLQRQLGTGKKADSYAGLGLARGLTIGLRGQLAAIGSFDHTITVLGARLSVAQTVLGQLDELGHAVKRMSVTSTFVIDQSGQTADQRTALGYLDQMIGALQVRVGDQYLFSGKSPDQPPVAGTSQILDGQGARAGLRQIIAERAAADLGDGLGRLVIPAPAAATVSVSEDAASPFGLKLAAVASTLTGAIVTGPAGDPASLSIDLGAATLADGDAIRISFDLPDGTSEDLTLVATTAASAGPGQFTIGATADATAANLQAALAAAVGTLAETSLSAASALAAANDFFNIDDANAPRRVAGPPFEAATALLAGTSADTMFWYTGEAGSDAARMSALARVDASVTVSCGLRANEPAIRGALANCAVFAALTFSPSDANGSARYAALARRVAANLDEPPGTQKISDIGAEIANAQTTMNAAKERHQQTVTALGNLLQSLEGVPTEEVGAQILALQTRLQATLQTTALLARTNLVDFL